MEEILLDMQSLFDGLEVEGLVPLDQVLNISINTKKLPTSQGWGAEIVGQTPTPTKPTQTSELTQEAAEEDDKPACESEPEPESTQKASGSPQTTALDEMTATAKRILSENPDIAQWILDHWKVQPEVPLRPEEFQTLAKSVEGQPPTVETQIAEPTLASPSNRPTSQRLRKSPRGKFLLTPRRGVGFSLGIAHETSLLEI